MIQLHMADPRPRDLQRRRLDELDYWSLQVAPISLASNLSPPIQRLTPAKAQDPDSFRLPSARDLALSAQKSRLV